MSARSDAGWQERFGDRRTLYGKNWFRHYPSRREQARANVLQSRRAARAKLEAFRQSVAAVKRPAVQPSWWRRALSWLGQRYIHFYLWQMRRRARRQVPAPSGSRETQ